MKKTISLFALLALLSTFSLNVLAQQTTQPAQPAGNQMETGKMQHKHLTREQRAQLRKMREQRDEDINKRLNLTDTQKQQFKQLRESTQAKLKPLRQQMGIEIKKLKELEASKASSTQISEQKAKIKSIKKAMKDARVAHYKATKSILTPQQQAEYEKIRKERRAEFSKKHAQRCENCPKATK